MRVERLRVRVAGTADVAGVVALERGIAEAPHWAEGEYAAMVDADRADSSVRRCFFVAEAEGRLLGFAVGKVIGSDAEGWGDHAGQPIRKHRQVQMAPRLFVRCDPEKILDASLERLAELERQCG